VAVKIFRSDESSEDWAQEVGNMARLHHPNIVQFLGACLEPYQCIVSEFCHHGSIDALYKRKPEEMTAERRMRWIGESVSGMVYLHSVDPPLLHRDLKCANILLDQHWIAKVCDFGISKAHIEGEAQVLTKAAGTIRWTAPEVLSGTNYGLKADVYSFAIVIWEMYAMAIPYDSLRFDSAVEDYVLEGGRPNMETVSGMEPHMKAVMRACWVMNPADRPDFVRIMELLEADIGTSATTPLLAQDKGKTSISAAASAAVSPPGKAAKKGKVSVSRHDEDSSASAAEPVKPKPSTVLQAQDADF